ncbi:MAG: hypothetical protein ACE5GU_05465 [Candidatus Scalinduaceae bacterium]
MLYKKLILSGLLSSIPFFSISVSAKEESPFLFKGFDFLSEELSEEPSIEFINNSFDDLYNIFGKYSTLTSSQKEESWYKHKGKYVRWQGIVTYKDVGENNRQRIGVRHNVGTNVELIFDDNKKDTVRMISRGNSITYTGRLSLLFNRNLLFKLEDANIEKINGVLVDELKKGLEDKATSSLKPSHIKDVSPESELKESSEVKTNVSFDDLNNIFGKDSSLTYTQKEEQWDNYKGRYITWQGVVTYKGVGEKDWKRIGISHKAGTNAELIFDDDKKDLVKMVNKGDSITYTGKLAKLIGRNLLCSIVDVDIKKIGDKIIHKAEKTTLKISASELPTGIDIKNKVAYEAEITMSESMAPKVIKKDDIKITETLEGFIDISFEELDKIFGKENRMTESQKDKLWEEYKGKYVRWTGKVVSRGLGRVSGLRMGINHKEGTDIELCFDIEKKDKVLQTKVGDTVTYTGKLVNRRGYILPYKLEDGKIENITDIQLTTENTEATEQDSYNQKQKRSSR